ncbi:Ppx/GppA phosphatase family protein [Halanaerobium saccharolyticum]|uniref:Ppx/GppA phosphatase family protein n=1 Tax=Halanaerobium saccharolyticum TaxID=43595 RepID=UPI001FB642F7|nr:Ppx/GppA phosphatase family protein [Halanaerobium saccharolyticum]
MSLRAAAIDIGTNSCRLLIGEKSGNNSFDILARELEITRLGEGVDKNRELKAAAVERVYQALKKFRAIIDRYQVEKLRVVGTSALRDVDNAYLLKDKLQELNFKLEIISGEKEAELNYAGAVSNLENDFLLIDIGGGSTEFIWSEASEIKFKSLDIGCVRMTEKFVVNPATEFKTESVNKISNYVNDLLASELDFNREFKIRGVGGTITTLAAIKLGLEVYDSSKIENTEINKKELEKIINKLSNLNLKERKNVEGLQPQRADIIIAGLIILKAILDFIDSSELSISDHDLLHGLIKNQLNI